MSGLNTSLLMALGALNADEGAIQTTTNNIDNVNTPGYTREVPIFEEGEPADGGGVILDGFQSIRNEMLQLQIEQETQQQSGAQAQSQSLQQIQPLFGTSGTDIGSEMSAFFASLSSLSSDPSSLSLRQSVIDAGQNLAGAFNATENGITQLQGGLNESVTGDVNQINQLTQQIASLNTQMQSLPANEDGGTVEDQRDQLITQLSQLTGISVTQTPNGVTLTTGNGTPLVVGGQSFALSTREGSNGMEQVLSQGQNITANITGGDLGGSIQVRDQVLPGYLNQLDTLASQFSAAVNSAQAKGYDLNGNAGQDFFTPVSGAGAAAQMSVAITDPALIAASSDGTSGSNGNLTNLIGVQTNNLPMGSTPTEAYAGLVSTVGTDGSNASAEAQAGSTSLQQLSDELGSISGVSVDEESTNLIQYQTAYQAAARVISTVEDLNSVAIGLGNYTGT